MNINVKSIGFKKGTSGWLIAGLVSGEIEIKERLWGKNNTHALVISIKEDKKDYLLALFDEGDGYNLGETYHTVDDDYNFDPCEPVIGYFTPAARRAVMAAAQEWCDKQEKNRANDESVLLKVVSAR